MVFDIYFQCISKLLTCCQVRHRTAVVVLCYHPSLSCSNLRSWKPYQQSTPLCQTCNQSKKFWKFIKKSSSLFFKMLFYGYHFMFFYWFNIDFWEYFLFLPFSFLNLTLTDGASGGAIRRPCDRMPAKFVTLDPCQSSLRFPRLFLDMNVFSSPWRFTLNIFDWKKKSHW